MWEFKVILFYYLCTTIFRYNVIGRSRGLEEIGSLQLHLVIALFLAWSFCVAAVIKGVKSLGKVSVPNYL